ncbi:S-layer homology domain-containing protein [Niallia oryzisoli]|uniref:S-layer homology domain-containing protein n=1 Tax=Niallia oryzisoli TaxID=1737571 RepID=A0ABZ2CGW6_9BACI
MKSSVLKVGLITCLATGLFYGEASAETGQAGESVSSYSEVNQNVLSFQVINKLLTDAAINAGIPPEVVKAVAEKESGWKQFDDNGDPLISEDGGIGIMQITNQSNYDEEKLKNDIVYNINAGVAILESMYERTDLPKIKGADKQVIENWYFPFLAYNGTKPVNSPLEQATGNKNLNAYQEQVFALIEKNSFINGTQLGEFPFKTDDFQYDSASDENIKFLETEYIVEETHDSVYSLKKDDHAVVTVENVNLRPQPDQLEGAIKLSKNTELVVTGDFLYDPDPNSKNQFVWVPVETVDKKNMGYISSAYIEKVEGTSGPITVQPPVTTFTDVAPKYQDAVNFLVSKGVKGTSEATFGTDYNIKRVDAAVMLANALELDIESAPASGFTDVPARAVKHVNALKAKGITSGKTETTFDSQSEITRGELAIWIQRAFDLQAGNSELPFDDVADRYSMAVSALVNNGVTKGTSDTSFGTHDHAKRGDYALFLYRAAE